MTVASHRQHKQFDLLTFEEVGSLNEAEQLKESILKVEKEHLGSLDEGEFYFHEIIGCEVYDEEDKLIGQIKEILTPGANDVWVVGRKGKKMPSSLIFHLSSKQLIFHPRKYTLK